MNSEGQPTLPSLGCSLQRSTHLHAHDIISQTHIHTLKVPEKFKKN